MHPQAPTAGMFLPREGATVFPYRFFLFLTFLSLVFFASSIALLHFLSPETDPIHQLISEYAQSPWGWLLQVAMNTLATGFFCFSVVFIRLKWRSWMSRIAFFFFGVAVVCLFVAACFPYPDPEDPAFLVSYRIHNYFAGTCFISVTTGIVIASCSFFTDIRWMRLRIPAFLLAVAVIYVFVKTALANYAPRGAYMGIWERVCTLFILLWIAACALYFRKLVQRTQRG
jgi:Protein of unknown function (DUF998)